MSAGPFYLHHGYGTAGPFCTESVEVREAWMRAPTRRGSVIPCRFKVKFAGRWHRLFSDRAMAGIPHFIRHGGERIAVTGVCP